MASRQEEKERRRQERVAREQAEAKSAAARKRLQLVGGGVLALAAVAAVVIALVSGLGGGDDDGPTVPNADTAAAAVKLPEQQLTDLEDAAKAAGCTVSNARYEGADHEDREFKPSDYETNPPTSGNHNPDYYQDGIYEPGTTPRLGMLVHTLEHGRINVQYRKGAPKSVVEQLEAFVNENEGYHMVMYENPTGMEPMVSATAWTQSLTCGEMSPKTFDALRTFRDKYLDKGPEKVP